MMIVWQAQSSIPENAKNLSMIADWWRSLNTKSVLWKQRLLPETGEVDWNPQKFDETFLCMLPDVRGITLYWRKGEEEQEKSVTPVKMELDSTRQRLLVYPETQKNVVISIEGAGVVRQSVALKNPAWSGEKVQGSGSAFRLVLYDAVNLVEVRVDMDATNLNALRQVVIEL